MRQIDLHNRVALVTGSGRGIGAAIATMLAKNGAHVILSARSEDQIKSVTKEILYSGFSAEYISCDISDESSVVDLFKAIRKNHGRLDITINNAGLGIFGPIVNFSASDLDKVLQINIRGTFLCCREALRLMAESASGYIINISSVLGVKGYANQAAYTASKHGIMGLTKSLAKEAQPLNIRVSAILPGGVDTEMVQQSRPDIEKDKLMQPTDIAEAVEYLLSLSERAAVDELYIRRKDSQPF